MEVCARKGSRTAEAIKAGEDWCAPVTAVEVPPIIPVKYVYVVDL